MDKKAITFKRGLDKKAYIRYNRTVRRRSLVVKPQLPKLEMRVRFPSPAPKRNDDFRKKIVVPFWFSFVFSIRFSFFSQIVVFGEKK